MRLKATQILSLCLLVILMSSCGTLPPPQTEKEALKASFVRSVTLLEEGDVERATQELETILSQYPNHQNSLLLLKQINTDPEVLLGSESFEYEMKPFETLSIVAERFLGNKFLFYALARFNKIDPPKQIKAGQIIKIPGGIPPSPSELDSEEILLDHAQKLLNQGDLENAISELEDGLKEFPGNQKIIQLLVSIYLRYGKKLEEEDQLNEARKYYLKAQELDKLNPEIGRLLEEIETPQKEKEIKTISHKATDMFNDNDYKGALNALEKGLSQFSNDPEAQQLVVDIYIKHVSDLVRKGECENAVELNKQAGVPFSDNEKILEVLDQCKVPSDAQNFYEKGNNYLDAGEQLKAFLAFKRAVEIDPFHAQAKENFESLKKILSNKYYREGKIAFAREDLEAAFCNWDLVVKINPKHDQAQVRRDEAKEMECHLDKLKGEICDPIDCSKLEPHEVLIDHISNN